LCRASTPCFDDAAKDVDGRDKPGHDAGENMTDLTSAKAIAAALQHRYGEQLPVDENLAGLDALARIASRKVHRRYLD
jgi:hypothetical protein